MRAFAFAFVPISLLMGAAALADDPPAPPPAAPPTASGIESEALPPPTAAASPEPDAVAPKPSPFARVTPPDDPTGGAWTTPTLLFVPAGAVPTWNVRVITSLGVEGPTAPDRLAIGTAATSSKTPLAAVGLQPGIGGELGLPGGFTFGAGTDWVGGDVSPTPASGGLSPYFQLRYHILGDVNGQGWQLGASVTYKFVGFQGDPGEMEWSVSTQYRHRLFEVGFQAVIGKDFATTDADGELHVYAVVRPIPQLALGAAAQGRLGLVSQPDEPRGDVVSGAIASLTLGRWQIAGLGGESTIGLNNGAQVRVGALGQAFATARF
jgi:hypothetical protein